MGSLQKKIAKNAWEIQCSKEKKKGREKKDFLIDIRKD